MSHRLGDWLSSATLGLALSERQRIVDEITAHVTDAIAYQTAQGLSVPDAEARAIQDLGDPQVARAAFSRTCYTLSDEVRLENLLGRSWWTLMYAWIGMALPIVLIVLEWLNIPASFQAYMGFSDSELVVAILISLATTPLYYFEPQIKKWLYKRFSSNGVFAVQAFMALIAAQSIGSAFDNFINTTQALFFGGGKLIIGTWIVVLFLTCCWLAQQAPLTLKTIRRTRA